MADPVDIFSTYILLMMISIIKHVHIKRRRRLKPAITNTTAPSRHIRYQAPIPYNQVARFTFVGLNDVLCYHLIRFTPRELERILPFLSLHEIRFRNRLQATPEEGLAVVLIRLSYPTRYYAMMDRSDIVGHGYQLFLMIQLYTSIGDIGKSLHRTKKGLHFPSFQDILTQFMTWEEDSAFGASLMAHSRLLVTQC